MDTADKPDYTGKRALMLLRVSTPVQEQMYGWPSQERSIRTKLIEPLGLLLDEERHILRDTYTGLEFKERPALDRILEMAERQEFDVVVMDVLDRLGRRGLLRELYRMQLRELGVRILTTDPDDHADDDTSWGEIIRYLKGKEAENELKNIRRRTMQGRRAKAEGLQKDGTVGQQKVVGNGQRIYGYTYTCDDKGKRIGLILNTDVILVDEDGTEWTEVRVVVFIFTSAAAGMSLKEIAKHLNDKGIPSPYAAKGLRKKGMLDIPTWLLTTVSKILHQSAYYGEYRQFRTLSLFGEKRAGKKGTPRRKTTEKEQVIIPIPAIVTKELALTAQERVRKNKDVSSRNNPNPLEVLLRVGLAKCGHCGGNLTASRQYKRNKSGEEFCYIKYQCQRATKAPHRCAGCQIASWMLDEAAWEEAIKIMRDPTLVEKKVTKLLTDDSMGKQRKTTLKKLADIHKRQASLRNDLSELSQEGKLDKGTREFLSGQLLNLAQEEEEAQKHLADEQAMQEKMEELHKRIAGFHAKCREWSEKLDDPAFTPSYQFKREACEFFGITVIVYRYGHEPPFETEVRPPSIVSLLS